MFLKTSFYLALAMFLLISCGEENSTDNTTVDNSDSTMTTTTPEPEPAVLTEEDKIQNADALMQQIDAAKSEQTIEKKRFINNAPNMGHDQSIYTLYSASEKMVKLTEVMGESMYLAEVAYYYQNDNIFLIHTISSFEDQVYSETKVYFEDGQPFAAIGRSKDEQDFDTDIASLSLAKMDLSAAIHNMEEYMKGISEIPTRLAASSPEE